MELKTSKLRMENSTLSNQINSLKSDYDINAKKLKDVEQKYTEIHNR